MLVKVAFHREPELPFHLLKAVNKHTKDRNLVLHMQMKPPKKTSATISLKPRNHKTIENKCCSSFGVCGNAFWLRRNIGPVEH
ncbi:---NA--- [Podarcis lilfordi]|uniref:---NA n=1 Tax=Podarcis lilfordi TaxID=74358 RepID=A0AA35K7T0_9SAUR|nr:---NA--- [Podarcis lilfordi]